jgi:hypothetical protein
MKNLRRCPAAGVRRGAGTSLPRSAELAPSGLPCRFAQAFQSLRSPTAAYREADGQPDMNHTPTPDLLQRRYTGDDGFDLYFSITPVVLIYGEAPKYHIDEHTHAGRLLRCLDDLGRKGIPLKSVMTPQGLLRRDCLRALNMYLRHGAGLRAFNRAIGYHSTRRYFNKYDWVELVRRLSLRFAPH